MLINPKKYEDIASRSIDPPSQLTREREMKREAVLKGSRQDSELIYQKGLRSVNKLKRYSEEQREVSEMIIRDTDDTLAELEADYNRLGWEHEDAVNHLRKLHKAVSELDEADQAVKRAERRTRTSNVERLNELRNNLTKAVGKVELLMTTAQEHYLDDQTRRDMRGSLELSAQALNGHLGEDVEPMPSGISTMISTMRKREKELTQSMDELKQRIAMHGASRDAIMTEMCGESMREADHLSVIKSRAAEETSQVNMKTATLLAEQDIAHEKELNQEA